MKWVLIVIGALVVLVLLIVLIGLLLPREHRATSEITLGQPPDSVWAAIRNLADLPSYWTDLKSSERVADRNGRESWVQTMKDGSALPIEIMESDRPRRLVTLISSRPGASFGGSWTYEITPAAAGSRLRVTEDGWVSNPIFRVVSRATGYHATLDGYLEAMGKRFGETSQPLHVEEEERPLPNK